MVAMTMSGSGGNRAHRTDPRRDRQVEARGGRGSEKQDYDWPLKHVGIVFEYDGIWYNMTPEALHVTNDAYFEVLSDEICDDLAAAGAEDVFCTAMLD